MYRWTDQELVDMWLHPMRPATQKAYRGDIEQFFSVVQVPIAEISIKDVQNFADALERRNLKPRSFCRKINAVKSLLNFCVAQGCIGKSPAAGVRLKPIPSNVSGKILTPEQIQRLIRSGTTDRDRVFLLVMYSLALRIFEACKLCWEDFSVQQNTGKIVVTIEGKGGKVADLVVPTATWEALQVIRGESSRVFPFGPRTANDIFARAIRHAGMDQEVGAKVTSHWLRHSHASNSLLNGAPLTVVRDQLRHSSVATTNAYLATFEGSSTAEYLGLDKPLANLT